ncbi:MAG TPA: glycosyltransferase family 2 protein [Aldersonia sp.]
MDSPPRTRSIHLVHGTTNRKINRWQMLAGLGGFVLATVLAYVLFGNYRTFLIVGGVLFSLFALVMSASFLVAMAYTKRESGIEDDLLLGPPRGPSRHAIAVLIPARHETAVLARTLLNTAWTQREHRDHRIVAVLNDDDPDTIRVAAVAARVVNEGLAAGADHDEIERRLAVAEHESGMPLVDLLDAVGAGPVDVLVYPLQGRPPNKPQQLNYAFTRLRSCVEVFTVLDAESIAAPGLLSVVDQAFTDHPDVDIIQGGIQLMDPHCDGPWRERVRTRLQRWYAWHNLLEYLRWFSSQMRYQSDKGFMPLGGNTVFLRTDLLAKTGGWPMSLTEDCELGVRATAVHGARTLTFYDPRLATREETPPDLHTLVKQRRRWNIGFIQSFVAGNWRSLPGRRQRLIACWILTMSLFQTVSFAMLPVTLVTAFWIDSPAPLAVAMCIPTIAIALAVALQMLQIHEYGRVFHRRVPWHVYPLFVATFYPYQLVLSFAAAQAVLWYVLGRLGWDKTTHVGDHFAAHVLPARGTPAVRGAMLAESA